MSQNVRDSNPILEARDVVKNYRIGEVTVRALDSVSLAVARGEFMALAGASGSGKTTLLNLFGCIDVATSGDVLFDGSSVAMLSSTDKAMLRARRLGFVFQTFNLIPVLSALENVEYPLILVEKNERRRRELAREAIAKVGLESQADRRPDQMSGGQRQRVAVARALVKRPDVILADEPTANLDRKTALDLLALMKKLNEVEGITFVFSSHDAVVLSMADRVFELLDGKMLKETRGVHAS